MIKIFYFWFPIDDSHFGHKQKFLKKTAVGSHFTLKMDEISSGISRFWFSASSGPVTTYLDWTISSKCGKIYISEPELEPVTGQNRKPELELLTGLWLEPDPEVELAPKPSISSLRF
jgi:hypothetical protein